MFGALTSKGYWIALVVAVTLAFGYAYKRDLLSKYDDLVDSNRQVNALESEVEQKVLQEQDLRDRVQDLDKDPVEIEAKVRSEGQVREGEKIYRIQLPSDQTESGN